MAKYQFLAGAGIVCLCQCFQTGFGAHPTSYPMGASSSFPGNEEARV